MASSDRMTWACTGSNQDRVRYFMIKAAIAVMAEAENAANHVDRMAYAMRCLTGQADVTQYTIGVATNSTIAAKIDAVETVSDSDLEYTVNSLFDAYAG